MPSCPTRRKRRAPTCIEPASERPSRAGPRGHQRSDDRVAGRRAARGLASLHVQANEIGLAQAGRFHGTWTPRHWSDPNSKLVGFEQLLYLRQPGYGPSYIIGKLQLDHLLARASFEAEQGGKPFVLRDVMARIQSAAIMPPALIEAEMFGDAGK